MGKPKVYITRALPEEVVEPYRNELDIEMWPEAEEAVDRELLIEKVRQSDGLVTMLSESIDEALLKEAESLKIVANLAVGYDNIDLKSTQEHGVAVTNTPDVLSDTTADLTFSLLTATARRIVEADTYIKEGKWQHWSPLLLAGHDIHHKTIGIVGMGRIGETVAKRATGFEMDILYHNRSRNRKAEEELGAVYVDFDDLLRRSDFVVCLTPLTEETHRLFDKQAFAMMKDDAIFINASRGAVVDEKALEHAIKEGEIAAAGLDVFENEPISKDHPLLQLPQVVCLPHIGSASKETRYAMMRLCLDNICRHFRGETLISPVQ
ncbi:D-glycerate dehydrogenase [Halobacillus sp. KGW1]|uniref:2-hydroxyacid dehydrogenase n=1 Tax=Halobacillus sp. KGW1 TaxID=1793726 RepID=UPI000781569B|nr:D-glycerate dehydrogenase [Halobacillus sp. KGW1]